MHKYIYNNIGMTDIISHSTPLHKPYFAFRGGIWGVVLYIRLMWYADTVDTYIPPIEHSFHGKYLLD